VLAEDISDLQIEGISIGDSLLDYLSEREIIAEIEINKKTAYNHLNDDFGEVYLYSNFDTYDRLSFLVKQKNKNYIIYSISGQISYNDKLEECFAKQKEIEKQFSLIYKKTEKRNYTFEFSWDPTGESLSHNVDFIFDSGDFIEVNCVKIKKSFKIEYNWEDGLQVNLNKKEIRDWFTNPIK
jgi:hypothetical protein